MDFKRMAAVKNSLLLAFVVMFTMTGCDRSPTESTQNHGAGQVVPDSEKPVLKFKEPLFRFKPVKEGEEVTHSFAFTNTGKSDLLISYASASCGCTVPEWPKEPIAPGESGVIKATFNTEGKQGKQNKKIVITANTKPELTEVHLEGEVLPKQQTN
jgi:hypothetical protein